MSGIGAAAALRREGIPEDTAQRLIAAIRPRGREELAVWRGDACALAHARSAAAGGDGHNLGDAAARLRIVGDLRLDNAEDLAAALGLAGHVSDGAVVLEAYRAWGPACCERLIGDFAFALWDEDARTLFCARDQFGVKPLFYAATAACVAVASELAGVVPETAGINESRIASYLLGIADEPDATIFTGACRLPPGHWLEVAGGTLTIQRYWTLEPDSDFGDDPVSAFRERFEAAVETRLRGPQTVGALLSGGLDSSAIAASGAAIYRETHGSPLAVYSFDYPKTPALSERPYVDAVLARHTLNPVFVGLDDLRPADGLGDLAGRGGDLLFAPGLPKIGRVYREACRCGTAVLLEGHGGDEVVSHGHGRIGELARDGRWFTLYRELRGVSGTFGESPMVLLLKLFASAGPGRLLAPVLRRVRGPRPAADPALGLNPDFARRTGARDRTRAWLGRLREAGRSEGALHRWTLTSPAIGEGFEALDRAATRAGVELRYPFFDQRLVRLSLALPSSEKLRDGWSRSILRRAMEGVLPPEVQWRRDKIDFTSELSIGLARHHRDLLDEASADGAGIGRYVDLGHLRALVDRLVAKPSSVAGLDLFSLWRGLFLMLWLKNEGAR